MQKVVQKNGKNTLLPRLKTKKVVCVAEIGAFAYPWRSGGLSCGSPADPDFLCNKKIIVLKAVDLPTLCY